MKQNKSMKKNFTVLSSLLFFLCIFSNMFFCCENSKLKSHAKNRNEIFNYEIICDGKRFCFFEKDFELKKLSVFQKEMRVSQNIEYEISKLIGMGFSKIEAMKYIFPETVFMLEKIKKAVEEKQIEDEVFVVKNSCEISVKKGKNGKFLNELDFFEKFENSLKNQNKKIKINIQTEYIDKIKEREILTEKSCFSTNFKTSSPERKNNIKVALEAFDGLVLEDGEVLSFNTTTGVRNEKAGYKKAKIISGGTFTEGFGGGVCQVSTTLYNACLLSGLEILEVHNHSLPVSYIEPSFDAMVNIGSSDLVIRNNSGGRLIFTSSSKDDVCKVKIFGKPNEFKITRFSEKIKVIDASYDEVLSDEESIKKFGVNIGEEKRISYSKDGFVSNGYLNFYDKNGNLIKTKKIRSNTYNPTRGIVVKNAA